MEENEKSILDHFQGRRGNIDLDWKYINNALALDVKLPFISLRLAMKLDPEATKYGKLAESLRKRIEREVKKRYDLSIVQYIQFLQSNTDMAIEGKLVNLCVNGNIKAIELYKKIKEKSPTSENQGFNLSYSKQEIVNALAKKEDKKLGAD